jgi:hypothetical protein
VTRDFEAEFYASNRNLHAAWAERDALRAVLGRVVTSLELVLLYHSGSPWDEAKAKRWQSATGRDDASTRALCDHIRCVLAEAKAVLG